MAEANGVHGLIREPAVKEVHVVWAELRWRQRVGDGGDAAEH